MSLQSAIVHFCCACLSILWIGSDVFASEACNTAVSGKEIAVFHWQESIDKKIVAEVEEVLHGLTYLLVTPDFDLRHRSVDVRVRPDLNVDADCSFDGCLNVLTLAYRVPNVLRAIIKNARSMWVHEYGHVVAEDYLKKFPGIWQIYFSLIAERRRFESLKNSKAKVSNEDIAALFDLQRRMAEPNTQALLNMMTEYQEVTSDVLAMVDQEDLSVIDREAQLRSMEQVMGIPGAIARKMDKHLTLKEASPQLAAKILAHPKSERAKFVFTMLEAMRLEIEARFEKKEWSLPYEEAIQRFVSRLK